MRFDTSHRMPKLGVAGSLAMLAFSHVAQAQGPNPCGPPIVNPVACENTLPGNPPSDWDTNIDLNIVGFATDISVNRGGTIQFKVKTSATAYHIDIYRIGYYGGLGARKISTFNPAVPLPQSQPPCLSDSSTGLIDCGNWAVSASWTVPTNAVSGVYIAELVATCCSIGASHIYFVVRDDSSTSKLLFKTSDSTWQAYNQYGGNSFYVGSPAGRAYKLSYNRPVTTRSDKPDSFFFSAEFPMVRFLEANGYDVSYSTDIDMNRNGALLSNHKVFLSVGHDEYWSAQERGNVQAARASGVHLAFFSGNEIFWKTRWENSIDGTNTPYRTIVCYKETMANAKIDPTSTWTGTWRDPRFSPPADGGLPENAMTGELFMVNGPDSHTFSIQIPDTDGKMRFWRNTAVAALPPGGTAVMPSGTLGYEWDESPENGFQPPGIVYLSTATYNVSLYLQDYGYTYAPGTATHHLTFFKQPNGAITFGAGTIQWAWGLNATHDGPTVPTDPNMQQATVNLLADMGAQPVTLQNGLVAATPSTDITPPSSAITYPTSGSVLPPGNVTITGTATDFGGGVVGAVEVSLDGGSTWHHVAGRNNWTYAWAATSRGSYTIKTRATDDSGNLETPSNGVTVIVGGVLTSITVAPANSTIMVGTTQQLAATGLFSDGGTQDITNSVGWSSSNTAVATITNAGSATAVSIGTSTIGAFSGSITGSTSLTVNTDLGSTTIGPSVDTGDSNYMSASRFSMGSKGGFVNSISVYIAGPISSAPNNLFQAAIYSDANGAPGNWMASSGSQTITGNSWNVVPISVSLSPNTAYWLVYNTNGSSASNNNLALSPGGTYAWKSQSFGSWPASFGTPDGTNPLTASIYAAWATAADTTPPTVPTGISGASTSSSVTLTWTASTDPDSPVAGYQVFRGPTPNTLALIGATGSLSYTDTPLNPSTIYYYSLTAYDPANNYSSKSTPISVTTQAVGSSFNFGNTTIGPAADTGDSNYMSGSAFTMGSQGGAVTSMSVYIAAPVGGSPNNLFQVAIYSNNGNAPGNLIAASNSQVITPNAWNSVSISTNLAANTTYWLFYNTNGSDSTTNNLMLSSGGAYAWKSQPFGSWPTSFGAVDGSAVETASIYATLH